MSSAVHRYILRQRIININQEDAAGRTPLYFAVLQGAELVEILLQNGAQVTTASLNTKRDKGSTPLHHLVDLLIYPKVMRAGLSGLNAREFHRKLELLLSAGASPNQLLSDGHSVLSLLCFNAMSLAIQFATRHHTPIAIPEEFSDAICKAVQILLKHGADNEPKHGANSFRVLMLEVKKMYLRVHHARHHQRLEKLQLPLDQVINILHFASNITEELISSPNTILAQADLKLPISTKTSGFGEWGLKRKEYLYLNWTDFEEEHANIVRLALLGTHYRRAPSIPMEGLQGPTLTESLCFPKSLEKVASLIPPHLAIQVLKGANNSVDHSKQIADTSTLGEAIPGIAENLQTLKSLCRFVIFHHVRMPRASNIMSLPLPTAMKQFVMLK